MARGRVEGGLVCGQRGVEILWKNRVYGSSYFRYDGDT